MITPSWSDDRLLTELGGALRAADRVPRDFIEAGKIAFAWRTVEVEHAALIYDSAANDGLALVGTRAESASLRALTFTTNELTIELEVTDDAIRGQLWPPCRGEIEVEIADAPAVRTMASADDVGYFVIRPVPTTRFRLRCHATGS